MDLLKCDFEFNAIEPNIQLLDLNQSLLWILHADKIPPHIGISTFGNYFSLKVNGKDEHLPNEKLLTLIQSKKISTVVIALSSTYDVKVIESKFRKFQKAQDLNTTCLTPIKELLAPNALVLRLKDLLEILKETGEIQKVYGLNLSESFKGILFYTPDEIMKRLELLKNA